MAGFKEKNLRTITAYAVFACLTIGVIYILVVVIFNYGECSSCGDPHWADTHIVVNSVEQAAELFGDDLLLSNIVAEDNETILDTEFILELKENGHVENRNTWNMLSTSSKFRHRPNASDGNIYLTIFFDEDNPDIAGTPEYPGSDSLLNNSTSKAVINNVEVSFYEYKTPEYKNSFVAKFHYSNWVYFLQIYSFDDNGFSWRTLERVLSNV